VRHLAPVGLLAALACSKLPDPPPPPPFTLPAIDLASALPKTPDGKYLLIQAASARIELDPTANDAITALGSCADLIAYCYTPATSVAACVSAAPDCRTETPWKEAACCPSACKQAYATAIGNEDELAAFERVFFKEPDCFPGVRAALEAK
jgi:hypothetical protein